MIKTQASDNNKRIAKYTLQSNSDNFYHPEADGGISILDDPIVNHR